ncbi:hypothetical protein chiPu_0002528 [Chiloscyllium punctatum]|uniref:Uncharacterized protein n=1 Tax=Chiloscyllium punctatum TaxID=137246 RepID=A0A401S175_CHIPU|nr:hypothetical protein [Chiloscyllium punctatum]
MASRAGVSDISGSGSGTFSGNCGRGDGVCRSASGSRAFGAEETDKFWIEQLTPKVHKPKIAEDCTLASAMRFSQNGQAAILHTSEGVAIPNVCMEASEEL